MTPDVQETTRSTWRTIDYIGGGFVLQVKAIATVEKHYTRNFRTKNNDFTKAVVTEVEDCFETDTEVRDLSRGKKGRIESIHQPHRVVHLSELNGIDMPELISDMEEWGGLK